MAFLALYDTLNEMYDKGLMKDDISKMKKIAKEHPLIFSKNIVAEFKQDHIHVECPKAASCNYYGSNNAKLVFN